MAMLRMYEILPGGGVWSALVLLLAMGTVMPAWAFSSAEATDGMLFSVNNRNGDNALLWKVERSGLRPSYVFATINSEDPRVTRLPPAAVRAFQLSDAFAMEMIPDHDSLVSMSTAMFIGAGPNLKSLVGEEYFNKLIALTGKYGISAHVLLKLKPWVVFTALTMPRPEDGTFLDVVLYGAALSGGKNVHGLETADEQVSTFEKISMDDQVAILKDVIDHYSTIAHLNQEIVARYARGDLDGVAALQEEYVATDNQRLIRTFKRHVVDDHSLRIVNRILPRIEEQNAFIAIDAELLPGDRGVLHLLQQRGYRISPVHGAAGPSSGFSE